MATAGPCWAQRSGSGGGALIDRLMQLLGARGHDSSSRQKQVAAPKRKRENKGKPTNRYGSETDDCLISKGVVGAGGGKRRLEQGPGRVFKGQGGKLQLNLQEL